MVWVTPFIAFTATGRDVTFPAETLNAKLGETTVGIGDRTEEMGDVRGVLEVDPSSIGERLRSRTNSWSTCILSADLRGKGWRTPVPERFSSRCDGASTCTARLSKVRWSVTQSVCTCTE